jgi:hypothetical protein
MSVRLTVLLVAAAFAASIGVDYAFHLDSPKPNRPAIRQLQRRVATLEAKVARLERASH